MKAFPKRFKYAEMVMKLIYILLFFNTHISAMTIDFYNCTKKSCEDVPAVIEAYKDAFCDITEKELIVDYDFKVMVYLKLASGTSNLTLDHYQNRITVQVQSPKYDAQRLIDKLEKIVEFAFFTIDEDEKNDHM